VEAPPRVCELVDPRRPSDVSPPTPREGVLHWCRSGGQVVAGQVGERKRRRRRLLLTTETLDRPIAAAAKIGLRSTPKAG